MVEGVSRKLARTFFEKIESGEWPVGERVPTTRKLAAEYGVSVNTIQSAFRELELSHLVERLPRLGGFVTGRPRGTPRASRATTIAVVVHHEDHVDASGTWGYRILRGCSRELAEADFHVAIFAFEENDPDAQAKMLAKIDEAGDTLAGVLCFTHPAIAGLPRELDARNIGWVSVNPSYDHALQNFVAQDARHAGRLIGRCAARMGLGQITFIGDRIQTGRSTGDLYLGFVQGWLELGNRSRDVDFVYCVPVTDAHAYECMGKYLKSEERPDLVFATGDYLAVGAVRALREAGLEVGRDVHVIGATGLDLAAFAHPPLTVSEVPMERMGQEAARMLLEMAREGVRRLIGRYIPAKLIVRDSFPIPAGVVEEESALMAEESRT